MKKIAVVISFVFLFFVFQFILFALVGGLFTPNFLLLVSIFFNLYLGIRYGLLSAVLAGLLMDSFSISPFGTHLFLFVFCTFMTTALKTYLYHMGSEFSRLLLVSLVCSIYVAVYFLLSMVNKNFDVVSMLKVVIIPEIVLTVIVSNYVFIYLKRCASKLFA